MKVEWECNRMYDDGQQSCMSRYRVYDSHGVMLGKGYLENHTFVSEFANEPEDDKKNFIRREFCYTVTDDFGWWNHGIDENPEYDTLNQDHRFGVWCKPEHTQYEVKKMIEAHIVEFFSFNESAERKEFEERMARMRSHMLESLNLESVDI